MQTHRFLVTLACQRAHSQGQVVVQVSETYSVDGARNSYYGQLFPLNPGGIIPTGPTAEDLKLGTDPKRGPLGMDALFLTRAEEPTSAAAAP